MRKLSITLLLIALSFITMEANILSTHKSKILVFKGWSERQKSVVFIPIEAVLEGHNIEVQFFEKPNEPVTFQVKDKNGNIVFQDMTTPDNLEIYQIDVSGFKTGQYELLYIEKDVTLIGEFEIEETSTHIKTIHLSCHNANINPIKIIFMKNISRFLVALCCSALFLFSCENEIESEIQSSSEELVTSAETKALSVDSLEPLKMTDELKALKERMDELKKTKTRAASSNYGQYFSENMWAIREMPFTLRATSGGYLTASGRGGKVDVDGRRADIYKQFYVTIPPSIVGVPYLIYSCQSETPLAVGHYTSNPNQKVVLAMTTNSPNEFSASWDIIPASNNPGGYVIQSESYIGQGSGGWWDVFNYVVEVQGSNLGYSQYSQKAEQEFTITPNAPFTLKKLEFINPYSATVIQRENISIQQATTNVSFQEKRDNLKFIKEMKDNSYFEEEKGIAFQVPASDLEFALPTVTLGEIDLVPNNKVPVDTKYEPGIRRTVLRTLYKEIPVAVKPRTKLTLTYYFKAYDVSVDYVATIEYFNEKDKEIREAKLPGRWSGRIYVDEIAEPDYEEVNLDTQRSAKGKANIKNVTQSSPLTF